MAQKPNSPNWPADAAGSPKEYGITRDGKLCESDDPAVHNVLVAKGGFIPWAEAEKYGLTEGEPSPGDGSEAAAATGGLVTSRQVPARASRRDLRTQKSGVLDKKGK